MSKIIVTREAIYVSVISMLLIFILGVEWTKLAVARDQMKISQDMHTQLVLTNAKVDKLFGTVEILETNDAVLASNDNNIFDQIDTIKISIADYNDGFVRLEGRVYKLERNHDK